MLAITTVGITKALAGIRHKVPVPNNRENKTGGGESPIR